MGKRREGKGRQKGNTLRQSKTFGRGLCIITTHTLTLVSLISPVS